VAVFHNTTTPDDKRFKTSSFFICCCAVVCIEEDGVCPSARAFSLFFISQDDEFW
jgi:hypothetical protein